MRTRLKHWPASARKVLPPEPEASMLFFDACIRRSFSARDLVHSLFQSDEHEEAPHCLQRRSGVCCWPAVKLKMEIQVKQ